MSAQKLITTVANIASAEDVAYFSPACALEMPRQVIVRLPATASRPNDGVRAQLDETDWAHSVIWMSVEVGSGIPDAAGDGWKFCGCARPEQLDRLIVALQAVVNEADRLGLRAPRPSNPQFSGE